MQLISNTSYFHRKEQTGYDGTLYNLGFYQTCIGAGFVSRACAAYLFRCSTATGSICRRAPPITARRPPIDNDQQNITAGNSAAVERSDRR